MSSNNSNEKCPNQPNSKISNFFGISLKGTDITKKNLDKNNSTDTYLHIDGNNKNYALLRNISHSDMHLSLDMSKNDNKDNKFSIRHVEANGCHNNEITTSFIVDGDKVGINTNSPDYNLDVVGSAKVSNNLLVGGDTKIAGKLKVKEVDKNSKKSVININ